MSAITPSTEVYLLKCPLAIDNANQLTFENAEDQYDYFMSLEKLYVDDFTYQRKDNSIRYPGLMDDLIEYNYCMYKNDNYSDKWFYAYINNIEYVNDNMSLISIKTDVFQSWQFDLTYKQSFVVREHTNDDDFYSNLEPEDFETGEYVIDSSQEYQWESYVYVLACTRNINSPYEKNGGRAYGRVYSGFRMYCFSSESAMSNTIRNLQVSGYEDSIVGGFMYPLELTGLNENFSQGTEIGTMLNGITLSVFDNGRLKDYEPRNKKLLNFPYRYITIEGHSGSTNILHWEKTRDDVFTFYVMGSPSLSGSWVIAPEYYNGSDGPNLLEAVSGAKFPQIGWQSDPYTNWLTQQSKNFSLAEDRALLSGNKSMLENELELYKAERDTQTATQKFASDTVGAFVKTAATAGLGAYQIESTVTSGLNNVLKSTANEVYLNRNKEFIKQGFDLDIRSIEAQKYEHSFVSPAAKGQANQGDVIFAMGNLFPKFIRFSIRPYFAKKIDKYFDMFGYATNKMKLPNITGRENWNYIKTARSNIIANIPQIDLQEIKKMFDNGITLWHNPSTFLDYTQSNEII